MTTTPELLAFQDICRRLDDTGIAYMLTGSLAMSYCARPRLTRAIDLVIALDAAGVGHWAGTLGDDYHADTTAIALAMTSARPWNIIHLPSTVKIDLIPRKDTDYRRTEFARRQRVELAGVAWWIVAIGDLVLAKLEWSRVSRSELQRSDVKQLLDAPLDRSYLQDWANRLGRCGLLAEAGHA